MDQALLVYGLQQSRPECRMDGERSVDDLMRQKIVLGREFNQLGFFASWRRRVELDREAAPGGCSLTRDRSRKKGFPPDPTQSRAARIAFR